MRLKKALATLIEQERVCRVATANPAGIPHLVPVCHVLADGKLYFVSQLKGTYVVAARPQFELLAHNVFDDDKSRSNASLAVSDGHLFLRNDQYLYCIRRR